MPKFTNYQPDKAYWPSLRKWLKTNYSKTSGIYNPVSFLVEPRAGKAFEVKDSWYDILILEDNLRKRFEKGERRILDLKTKGIHLIEVKASEKDGGSFGALT